MARMSKRDRELYSLARAETLRKCAQICRETHETMAKTVQLKNPLLLVAELFSDGAENADKEGPK